MQAWDSVQVRADVELGGTEQLYTFMLARDYQANAGQPGQVGVMSPILVGTDGVKRMGKSLGNYIGIAEDPYEQMKKFMRVSDENLRDYLTLLTDQSADEIDALLAGHPKEAKVTLAKTRHRRLPQPRRRPTPPRLAGRAKSAAAACPRRFPIARCRRPPTG